MWLPLLVTIVGLTISVLAERRVEEQNLDSAQIRFEQATAGVVEKLNERFKRYEMGLNSVRSLVLRNPEQIERADFIAALQQGRLIEDFPGALGIGLIRHIQPAEQDAFLLWAKRHVSPDYRIHQIDAHDGAQFPIILIEPLAANLPALGFDVASETLRRHAALAAVATGKTTLTEPVHLVQEKSRLGFMLMAPIYLLNQPHATPQQRQDALWGWAYTPLVMDRLMADIFDSGQDQLALSVYDIEAGGRRHLFGMSSVADTGNVPLRLSKRLQLRVGERDWEVSIAAREGFFHALNLRSPAWVLVIGAIITLLLAGMIWALNRTRVQALRDAGQAADSLKSSEKRFEQMVTRVPGAFYQFVVHPDGSQVLSYMSPKVSEMFNVEINSYEEFMQLMYPDDRRRWLELFDDPRDGVVRQFQGRFLYFGDLVAWWQAYSSQSVLDNGDRVINGLLFDITERKEIEHSLQAAQQRLELAIRTGGIGLWDWHVPSGNVACNQQAVDLLGYAEGEIEPLISAWQKLAHPDDVALVKAALQRHFRGETELYTCDYRLLTRAGEWKWVRDAGRVIETDPAGKPQRMLGTRIDIDNMRRKEEALTHSLALHDLIFQHASVGLALTQGRNFVRVSARLAEMLGYSVAELEGQATRIMYPDAEGHAEIGRLISEVLPGGQMIDHELNLLHKDGRLFWGRLMGKAIDCNDLSKGSIWIIEDFTERRRREELLEQARADAEAASRAKSEFLANMSHEIRTPLNAVIGFTSLLLDSEQDQAQLEFTQSIRTAGEALLALINDLLDFSKIEAGKMELETIEFDLRTTFDETLDIVAEKAGQKKLELVCLVQPSVPERVLGDPGRLRQVLLNLINNAIKFTAAGEIVIRVNTAAQAEAEVLLRVEVRDTGIGIPADVLPRLFSAFSQADASTTRKFGGTGLGLSICKRLVEAMAGVIGVESTAGQGACFWFELPLRVVSAASQGPSLPVELRGQRVIGVDDNATNRELLAIQLGRMGLQPTILATADELLQTLESDPAPYALAILDMQMPNRNGIELAESIHRLAAHGRLPLVLLTSLTVAGHARLAREAHFSAYLTKPVREPQLQQCINEVLQVGGSEKPAPLVTVHSLAEREAAAKPRVLLAEDNPVNQKVAVLILEKLGCRIDVASNGLEAVEALRKFPYDIVFMDCQMPEMDGYEATRAIRALPGPAAAVPVIALTANAFKEDQALCDAAGMSDFLSKPVTAKGLEATLAKWKAPPVAVAAADAAAVSSNEIDSIRKTLADMAAMLGDSIIPEVLALFQATADELLPVLRQATAAGDWSLLEKTAHRFKGTLAQIGALQATELAAALEAAGVNHSGEGCFGRIEQLRAVTEQIRTEFASA